MVDTQSKVREVAWGELFPWLTLLRSVRIALMARVIVLGAIGVFATMEGWKLLGDAFLRADDPVLANWRPDTGLAMWLDTHAAAPAWLNTSAHSVGEVIESASSYLIEAPKAIWLFFTRPFVLMFHSTLTGRDFLFLLCCVIWELLVWGLIGGAITRIAALKFTRDESPGLIAAVRHAFSKWPSYGLPPLIAMAGAGVFAIQLVVLGLIMRVDALAFLAALFWPFVILLGLMMAILLIGALVGWPLMWSTVSVEGTDAFDALSRSYAYTYHRPWRLLWYALFALFLAVVSMFVVKLFASSAILLGNWSIDWGLDDATMRTVVAPEPAPVTGVPKLNLAAPDAAVDFNTPSLEAASAAEPSGLLRATRRVIGFWKAVVALLVAGYQAGFLWVSAVGIYLLLRRDIDGVQTGEVYVDQAEEYGMPPMADDAATGVPDIAPREPALPGDTATP
jgi:hypothetical protein